jgi:hypothetical protein
VSSVCLDIKGIPNSASPPAPLLVGISRKSMLSRLTGLDDMSDRYWPTVALNTQSLRMIEAITASA